MDSHTVDLPELANDYAATPGSGITPWHQDQLYWPLDTGSTVTMWMPLVEVVPEMGCMRLASGSHKGARSAIFHQR
jgi:ectoine hydroxylase-related dioxygenase (phytanoyl-CoA dioxygenase family)